MCVFLRHPLHTTFDRSAPHWTTLFHETMKDTEKERKKFGLHLSREKNLLDLLKGSADGNAAPSALGTSADSCLLWLLFVVVVATGLVATRYRGKTGKTASASKRSSPKFVQYVTIYSVKVFPPPLICTFFFFFCCCSLRMSTKSQSRRRSSSASEMISFRIFGISVPPLLFPPVRSCKGAQKQRDGEKWL